MMAKQSTKKRSKNPVDVHVGQRVRMCRINCGVSQSALAKRLGITFQQVQKYEQGVNRIGAGRLFDIAQFFGVPVETLFPNASGSLSRTIGFDDEFKEILEFVSGVQGLKLCLSFLRIDDVETRKVIVALVQQLGKGDGGSDDIHPPRGRH